MVDLNLLYRIDDFRRGAADTLQSQRFQPDVPFIRHLFAINEKMEHTDIMIAQSHSQRILDLAERQGTIRPIDLVAIGAPRVLLTRMTAGGLLEKTGRGMYSLPNGQSNEFDSMSIIATKVPQAVFCLLTALQFHGLTTQLPRRIWIGMPRGSHVPRIAYPPIKMVQFNSVTYGEGVEKHQRGSATLRVYSVAKTIADCFKHRNTIGLDVALEALRDARASNKVRTDELWHYAKICRVANVMRPYLEAIQ